jgi:hypothetical protein
MRFARLALAAALIGGMAAGAEAVEVKQEIEVKAAPAKTWKKIGAWCAIKDWHPAIANCETAKQGKDSFRTLTLKDGGKIKEKLTATGKWTYSYTIEESPLPVKNYAATISVKADSDGDKNESDVVWTAKFDAKDKSEAEAKGVIEGIFKAGLDSIKAQIKADNDKAKADADARKAKIEAAKLAVMEKAAAAKAAIAEKAKQAADAAKAAYEKAKAAVANMSAPKPAAAPEANKK